MMHARADYARIQDPAGIIPASEPVMLFRGQDKHAAAIHGRFTSPMRNCTHIVTAMAGQVE